MINYYLKVQNPRWEYFDGFLTALNMSTGIRRLTAQTTEYVFTVNSVTWGGGQGSVITCARHIKAAQAYQAQHRHIYYIKMI